MMQRSEYVTSVATLAALSRWTGAWSAAALSCALLAGNAGAVELGQVAVHSLVGQPLVADIELTALAPDELTGLQVRLASPDVYRGANVRIHPALASLRLAVMQGELVPIRGEERARQFVHLTTRQAIDAEYLHLFLELRAGDRHSVRAVTIWPGPAAPAPPAPPVMPVAPAAPATATPLASAAPTVLAAPATATPLASAAPIVLAAPAILSAPAAPRTAPDPGPSQTHVRHSPLAPQSVSRFEPKPDPKPRARPEPKSGAQHRSTARSDAERERVLRADQQREDSAALGIENDALRSKITILEEKVAVLQQDYAAQPVAAVPEPAPVIAPVPVPAPVPAPGETRLGFWIAGAAALLLLVASGVLGFLYRKNLIATRLWAALSKRFRRKAIVPADAG